MTSTGLGGRAPLGRSSVTRRSVLWLISCATALLLVGCGGTPSLPTAVPTPTPTPTLSPKVVIVSVDGLPPDAFDEATVPNLFGLSRRGAYTWKAQTVFPSTTLPAHTSMLTGVLPSVHGLTWDDYSPEKGSLAVPTVFALARTAGLRTVLVVGKEKFRHLDVAGAVDTFVLTTRGDADVANEAIVQAQAGFDLMFVHFPDTDLAGHASGWLSPAYMATLTAADAAIGRLLQALPTEATVIVTSDHGGHGATHGSSDAEDMTIPWIVAGPRVTAVGRELTTSVHTVDTTVTALHVLGLTAPTSTSGAVVKEAFGE